MPTPARREQFKHLMPGYRGGDDSFSKYLEPKRQESSDGFRKYLNKSGDRSLGLYD